MQMANADCGRRIAKESSPTKVKYIRCLGCACFAFLLSLHINFGFLIRHFLYLLLSEVERL